MENPTAEEQQIAATTAPPPEPVVPEPKRPPEEEPYPPIGYAWYVVAILMIVYIFSFVDRQILGLLVNPIKRDLNISDTYMSYLMGFTFAVFYTFFGIPLGRAADSMSRRGIIAIGLFIWSLMTAGCGLAQRYWQLALLRMGVGVGEAALSPSAYSMITDYFPKEKLSTAMSVYGMGIYIGSGLAYVLGGTVARSVMDTPTMTVPLLGEIRSWQIVFFIVGIPGMLFCALLATVKEPIRRGLRRAQRAAGAAQSAQLPIKEVVQYMKANRSTLFYHHVGFALLSFSSYGTTAWIPTFFNRTHGWTAADAGIWYGAIIMIFGTVGIVFGGWLADRMAARGRGESKMRVGLIAGVLWAVTGLFYPLVSDGNMAMLLLVPTVFLASMPFGVAAAAVQEIMPNNMRGQASAIYLFVVNLIGLGIGPTAIAWATDFLFNDELKLRYSILLVTTAAHVVASILLWLGIRPYRESVERVKEWHSANA